IGVLKATVDQRLGLVQQIAEGVDPVIRPRLIASMVTQYPIRNTAAAIVAEEQRLLARRKAEAERLRNQTLGLTSGAMFAQLLLLGLVTYFSQRQIGRRLEAERESQGANARAQTVLQTVREPIVLLDAQQRVMMHNTAFSELHGIEDDDAVGVPLAEVGNGVWRDSDTLQRLNDVVTRNREIWDHEQPQRTADGNERVMLVNARQMPLTDQEDRAVLMTMTDITTRKAAEARINELNRQLEGKVEQVSDVNRELEAFSYSVSHDLRAPLRHIAGFADKLGKQLGDTADEKSRHYLGVIGESAKRMSTLIDDLLVYSQLGRSALRLRAVDMQSLVAETQAMLDANTDSDTPDRRIEWRIGTLPILVADENMLRQVWQNLLGNAVKYSARSDPAIIGITHAFDDDGSHHFTVQDNGAGFDMAYAGKLFGVFQRLHKASDYPGTGIGLASVRRALMRHGGSIRAEASLDEGATFHFTLPATLSSPTANRETHA
ncbi:MAG: ATP-binding protein, partial [Pseudomonadota bacterium]|nr:ATP-binding protein [Pseudomonadota bacterium]